MGLLQICFIIPLWDEWANCGHIIYAGLKDMLEIRLKIWLEIKLKYTSVVRMFIPQQSDKIFP